jgi:hypothetical protein
MQIAAAALRTLALQHVTALRSADSTVRKSHAGHFL